MALEQVFVAPGRIRDLRSGPLGGLLEGFCDWLLRSGFRRSTVQRHVSIVSRLGEHLGGPTAPARQTITAKDIDGFFQSCRVQCRNRGPLEEHLRGVRWSLNRFVKFLDQKGLFIASGGEAATYQPLLDGYLQWMRQCQDAAAGTLKVRRHSTTLFLQSLGEAATPEGLASLRQENIEQFFLQYARSNGRAACRSMQSALRTFLRYCLHQGYIRQALDRAVPTLRVYKLSTVPRGLSESQAQQVLESVDRRTAVGRRNYAILRLLDTYGVRGGQVRALRLEDINWAANEIHFKASKRGKNIHLPLTAEVGQGLLDYLQNSRPPCSCREVFLTCRAPYRPLPKSSSLSAIVRGCIRASGIDSPVNGAHAFRHGFATRMVQRGHSLKAIADVLGHCHLGTTFIYAKVDFNSLEQVPLEWPEVST